MVPAPNNTGVAVVADSDDPDAAAELSDGCAGATHVLDFDAGGVVEVGLDVPDVVI